MRSSPLLCRAAVVVPAVALASRGAPRHAACRSILQKRLES